MGCFMIMKNPKRIADRIQQSGKWREPDGEAPRPAGKAGDGENLARRA
jgi:hypothetical protein